MTALRRRLLEDMQVRQLSPHTQRAYVNNIAQFARYFGQSPDALGPDEIRTYQVYLTNDRKLAPSSISMAVSALRFLYTVTLTRAWRVEAVIPAPKQPRTLPVVLSPEEVVQCLASVTHPMHRTILTTWYAAGLWISEAIRLTAPAIDSQLDGPADHPRHGAAGPLRDALPEALGDPARLVDPDPARALALSGRASRPTDWASRGGAPLPPGSSTVPDDQAHDASFATPRVRGPPSRSRYRRPHDPAPPRAPESRHHGAVSAHRDHHRLRDGEPARRTAAAAGRPPYHTTVRLTGAARGSGDADGGGRRPPLRRHVSGSGRRCLVDGPTARHDRDRALSDRRPGRACRAV